MPGIKHGALRFLLGFFGIAAGAALLTAAAPPDAPRPGTGPAVYLFLGTQCPVANAYTPRILALAKRYSGRGVRFFGVYPQASDSAASAKEHARQRGYTFPLVEDGGTLVSRLGATTTPEAVVVDKNGVVRYRGRIDDNKDPARVTSHDLRDALDAVLAGKVPARARTRAFGCVIQPALPKPSQAAKAAHAKVTYARDVAPILQKNCLSCHRAGEVAPFGMESYRQVAAWAQQIKRSTAARRMPPWKADSHGEFHDERRLADKEIATLAAWADAGAPLGNPREAPPAPTFGSSGWKLGNPDLVAGTKAPYAVGPEGRDLYHCFVLPTDYDEDRYVSALEVQPGNRAIVHHVIAWIDTSGQAERLDAADPGEGYTTTGGFPGFTPSGFLGGWAPGNEPRHLPQGVGMRLPKGARIVMEVHYNRSGKPETDQTRIGLHFSEGEVNKRLRVADVINTNLRIPAGDPSYTIHASKPIAKNVTVLAVMPHMHLLGREINVSAILPDGRERPLVKIPDWDFNWQVTYTFKQPLNLPAGSALRLTARYDNSADNPRNPNRPPKPVTWGEQTKDEMALAFVFYTVDDEQLTRTAAASAGKNDR